VAQERLKCPTCGGTRIARLMEASVAYEVKINDGIVDIVRPADVVGGHTQYELIGPWGDNAYCMASGCETQGGINTFIADDEQRTA
jgi:hypothetical protein